MGNRIRFDGNIKESLIAGRDIRVSSKDDSALKLQELLTSIQGALSNLTVQRALAAASPETVRAVQEAEASIRQTSESMQRHEADAVRKNIKNAKNQLDNALDEVQATASKAGAAAKALKPLVEVLPLILNNIIQAAHWAGNLF
jgi:hypothetical protein